jgi:hypothetical protein
MYFEKHWTVLVLLKNAFNGRSQTSSHTSFSLPPPPPVLCMSAQWNSAPCFNLPLPSNFLYFSLDCAVNVAVSCAWYTPSHFVISLYQRNWQMKHVMCNFYIVASTSNFHFISVFSSWQTHECNILRSKYRVSCGILSVRYLTRNICVRLTVTLV